MMQIVLNPRMMDGQIPGGAALVEVINGMMLT